MSRLHGHLFGDDLHKYVREEYGETVFLSFSCGKDSIATYLAIKDYFNVIPYYLYYVPDLEFVEESLGYYERTLFKGEIIRLPSPSFYDQLRNFTFQPPHRAPALAAMNLPKFSYEEIGTLLREDFDAPKAPLAIGTAMYDSPFRLTSLKKYGPIRPNMNYYPIWHMKPKEIMALVFSHGVKLPKDYHIWGRSFDGLDYKFIKGVRDNFPNDFDKIKEWFPLIGAELFRTEEMLT